MNLLSTTVAIIVVFSTASARALPVVVDDFNDGTTDGWTTQAFSLSVSGGFMTGESLSLGTLDGEVGHVIGVDAVTDATASYVALILNFTSLSDNLFVKIQDDDGNGLFDRVYFYHGNNSANGALSGVDFFDLSFEIAATYFQVTDHADGTVSAYVAATGDTFGGTLNNEYEGTAIGLGFLGNGKANNFFVPEPTTFTLVALGMLALGAWRSST